MTKHAETFSTHNAIGLGDWLLGGTNGSIDQPVRLLSVQELADFLQVPVQTIYGWRKRGKGQEACDSDGTCGLSIPTY